MTIDARGGSRDWARRLAEAWPLTLGLAVLAVLLLAGAVLLLTHGRAGSPAPAASPTIATVAPPAAPVAVVGPVETGTVVQPTAPAAPGADDAPPQVGETIAGLAGEWTAADPATRSLTRVRVHAEGEDTFVHVWGACHPDDCDWGEASADLDLDRPTPQLEATYQPGFATERLVLRRVRPGRLAYRLETDFTDGSGRGRQVSEGFLKPAGG